jgi:hypothetical protein
MISLITAVYLGGRKTGDQFGENGRDRGYLDILAHSRAARGREKRWFATMMIYRPNVR